MSEIRATTISDETGNGPIALTKQIAAKSFINHNAGTAINDSFNVTSLVDYGTGYHQHSFTSAHSSKNYASSGCVIGDSSTQVSEYTYSFIGGGSSAANSVHTANTLRYSTLHHAGSLNDHNMVQLITVGDLA